ncbi:hypothetical protein LINGRAHAP2_LOCUS28497 [Linum grandiflorum]
MMMTFCKKSVHSFLGFPPPLPPPPAESDHLPLSPSPNKGLGLITPAGDFPVHRPPNVVESASVVKPHSPIADKFIDLGVDGLTSCTESLGFESCGDNGDFCSTAAVRSAAAGDGDLRWRDRIRERRRRREAGKVKKFPPPISSLNKNGQPNFFLRPVRRNGRLELTEVRIDRPEILRATREDGRLRLLLVRDDIEIDGQEEEEEQENTELDSIEEDDQVEIPATASFCAESDEEEKEEEEEEKGKSWSEEEKEEEERMNRREEWNFPVNGEGFRRCYDLVNHRHVGGGGGGEMHMWRQHCVTTR